MNKPGHPELFTGTIKAAKAVTRPVNLLIAGVALSSLLSFQEAQGQIEADTIYGTGIFSTQDSESGLPIENVLLTLRPESMAMVTPDTTYTFITDDEGWAIFDNPGLPVYIDSTTGIQDLLNTKTQILPTFGSEMNAFFPSIQKGTIEVYNMSGQLVKKHDFNTDHEYLPFDNLSAGMYVYNIQTEEGIALGGKFMKQNVPPKGPAARPTNNSNSTVKGVQLYEAQYWAKWEHPNFYTDSVLVTLEDGNNGFINFFLTSNIPDPIDNQDLAGFVLDMNNNNAPIQNATVEAYIIGNGQTISTTSASDGSFVVEGVPLGVDILYTVKGVAGKGDIVDFPYTTPDEIPLYSPDSVWNHFTVVLPDEVATTTWERTRQQNGNGTNQETIEFYLGNSFNETQKNLIRNYFTQFQADENNSYDFVESSTQLSGNGINIGYGTYNTQTYFDEIETPLGNTLFPATHANSTMGTGNYNGFVHEIKRALGYNEVSWYSVMKADAPDYTTEDKDIAREISALYWQNVYDGTTNIPIQYIGDAPSKSNGPTKNNLGKIKANQFESSNSFGNDVEPDQHLK